MPISLPNSPTNGQTVQIGTVVYTYDATAGVWNSEFESGVSSIVHTSDTAPLNPTDGDIWFDSSIGKTFIWYNDGTSSQWIQMNPNTGGSGGANLGSVSESIIPDTDITYDLGSSSKKFKDLYLSGSTLNLGNQSISATATGIVVPEIQIGSGTNNVKLTTNASGNLITTETDSSGNSGAASPAGGAATIVADMAGLIALTGMAAGSQAYVSANNRLYFYTGSGWYLIATVQNDAPSAITGVDGSYALATDGTATTITAVSTDPEGFALTWSYAASGLGSIATVSQADNVFTVTPSTDAANVGSFTLTISATDGINGAVSTVPSFTLSFVVANSRYTSLSVKATATGSNQTFDDASDSNHTITANGDLTASTFSPYRHGGYSLKFENSGADDNNIKFDNTTGSGAVAASGEFCVETWVKFTVNVPPSGSANARIFASNGSGGNAADNFQFLIEYSGSYIGAVTVYSNGFVYQASSTAEVINDGQWHHLAATRDSSNNLRWFIDGALITTIASNTTTFQFEETRLGKRDGGTGETCFTGDMRDTRVVIGSSVYESAFTPPTEPLTAITNTYLLVGDLTYIKDESTNNFSIHAGTFNNGSNVLLPKKSPISLFDNSAYSEADNGASVKIESSGSNRLTSPITAMGTGDFTISGWVYTIGSNNPDIIFDTRPISADASTGFYFAQYNAGYFYIGTASNNFGPIQGTTNYPKNAWNHFAIVRDSSGNLKMYINGNLEGTDAIGTSKDLTSTDITIGSNRAGSSTCNAYVSDLKIESTAVYTAAFTPSTTPAVSDSNTTFLFNPETSISDLSQRNALICRGDLETSTTQVKFAGTKSIYFAGSDDYIHVPNSGTNSAFSLNSTKFTIEGWFYKETNSGDWDEIISKYRWSSNLSWRLKHNTNGTFTFDYSTSGSNNSSLTSTGTLGTGAWAHVALVANNNLKLYINGVGEVLSASALPAFYDTSYDVLIGALRYDNTNNNDGTKIMEYNGWMQDLRIHNNHAQYTANFTPPTAELEG